MAVSSPPIWRWLLGYLIVGACWGFTTPFMRRAAVSREQQPQEEHPFLTNPNVPWIKKKTFGVFCAVLDLLKDPAYGVPFLLNATGSVWFFLLIGQAGTCEHCRSVWRERADDACRTEPDCAHHQLPGFPLHSTWRMVGGRQGHSER